MVQIITNSSLTVNLEIVVENYLRQHGDRHRRSDLTKFMTFLKAFHKDVYGLCDLSQKQIERFRDFCLKTLRNKVSTVVRHLATLNHFFAEQEDIFPDFRSPAKNITWPRQSEREPKWFTDSEVVALRVACAKVFPDAFRQARARLVVELGIGIGMRLAEMTNVLMCDISPDELLITVIGKGGFVAQMPTTKTLQDALQEYLPLRQEELLKADKKWNRRKNQLFYPLIVGTRNAIPDKPESFKLNPKTVWRIVRTLGNRAGVADAHTHRLRHSFVDRIYRASGKDLVLTKRAARHANISTTMLYAQRSFSEVTQVINSLD